LCMVRSGQLTHIGRKREQADKRMLRMESFARTPELRARIAAGRAECASYFWKSLADMFRR